MKPITTQPGPARTGWPFPAAPQHQARLPELCNDSGELHSTICSRGTKGCTLDHQHGDAARPQQPETAPEQL